MVKMMVKIAGGGGRTVLTQAWQNINELNKTEIVLCRNQLND